MPISFENFSCVPNFSIILPLSFLYSYNLFTSVSVCSLTPFNFLVNVFVKHYLTFYLTV
nr:MAG TPA: hypothetical protein [Caudoviricetes sp.]DAY95738.1 MAG TPA: hypothetical protein [Caudoviricetes sp.]